MSTVEDVHEAIVSEMMRGELAPGSWLRQDEIAERLGTSKIPVREALNRLAASGLLRFETNRGAFIPHLTADEAEENFQLRLAVEVVLLRQAVPKLTIVDLAEAELALEAPAAQSSTEANWSFHEALYKASDWSRGLAIVRSLHAAVAPYVLLYTEGLGGSEQSHAQHLAILRACRSNDPAAACTMLERHINEASVALIDFLGRNNDDRL